MHLILETFLEPFKHLETKIFSQFHGEQGPLQLWMNGIIQVEPHAGPHCTVFQWLAFPSCRPLATPATPWSLCVPPPPTPTHHKWKGASTTIWRSPWTLAPPPICTSSAPAVLSHWFVFQKNIQKKGASFFGCSAWVPKVPNVQTLLQGCLGHSLSCLCLGLSGLSPWVEGGEEK